MSLVLQAWSYWACPWETWYSFTATNPWHHAITRYIIMFWIQGRMYWFREVLSQSTGTMSTYRAIVNFYGNMLHMHTTVRCMTQRTKKSVYDTNPWHHAITVQGRMKGSTTPVINMPTYRAIVNFHGNMLHTLYQGQLDDSKEQKVCVWQHSYLHTISI